MAKGDRTERQESVFTPEEARLRLKEAGIDAEHLDDATALLRDRALRAQQEEQAINDLIRRHTPRKVIGAPEPEELSVEDKIEVLQLIGEDEFIAAHLGKDPTRLTPKDRAEFERRSGHDAVIEAVLGTPLSDLGPIELAQARSALRNQQFEERIAGRNRPGRGSTQEDPTPPPGPPPGTDAAPGAGAGGGTEPADPGDPGGTPPDSNPTGNDGPEPPPPDGGTPPDEDPGAGADQVTGGSDDPGAPPPDSPDGDGDPTDGEVVSGSDDPEAPPPEGDGSGGGSGSGTGSAAGGGSSGGGGAEPSDAAPPEDTDDTEESGGFDYYGPTNPSGQSGEYHRDEDGTWTDEDGDEVTDPATVASLEHEYERYQEEAEKAEQAPPEDSEEPEGGEGEGDSDDPDDDEEAEEGSTVEFTPSGDEGAPLPDDLQEQLNRDFADLRNLRGNGGDGVTDPADDAGFEVRDPSVQLPTHAELGQSLFGQPPLEPETGAGGGNVNPGANPHGGGVTDPTDDQVAFDGPQRDDDPLDTGPEIEPPAAEPQEDPGAESVLLPPRTASSRVDDGPDLPDDLTIQPPD